jgi:hypothetical protein
MTCVYKTRTRPSRNAKRAREIWDRATSEDGAEPQSLKLIVSEGGFRDWVFLRANGELDEIQAGLVGVRHNRNHRMRDGHAD